MNHAHDDGPAISYLALRRGTPVRGSDGVEVGRVRRVQNNAREHIFDGIVDIFDGIVVETREGRRFVDAPEVTRIAERAVTLTIPAADVLAAAPPPSRVRQRIDHIRSSVARDASCAIAERPSAALGAPRPLNDTTRLEGGSCVGG